MTQRVRIGIISFAHLHAEGYINNLRANPQVEFVGFSEEDAERRERFSAHFNSPSFASHEALLDQGLDGVLICSENTRHLPLIEMAAARKVHVMSEKPLATTLEDARAAVDVCRANDVLLMTAFPMRYSAPVVEVKRLLEGGGLGQVYAVNGTNQGECPQHHRAWFVNKSLSGGGAMMDHIVHVADLLRWMLGVEVSEVYAQSSRVLYADQVPADIETGGLVMLTFNDGTFASIDCSWSKPPYYPTWGGLTMDFVGEKGVVTMNAFRQNLTVYRHSVGRAGFVNWGSDANQAMIDDFVSALMQGASPRVTGLDGMRAVEIVTAAYQSAETGQPVRLH